MLGRDDELRSLSDRLDEAAAGPLSVHLVLGPTGIGKTSLISAALAPRLDETLVIRCTFDELDHLIPYALTDALVFASHELGVEEPTSGGQESEDRVVALSSWFRAIVHTHDHLVVVCEDVHNLDAGSLRVLSLLIRSIRDLPIALLLTGRTGFDDRIGDLVSLTERMASAGHGSVTVLHALDTPVIAALARDVLGHEPGPAVMRDLVSASAGNPFLVDQLLTILARNDTPGFDQSVGPLREDDGQSAIILRRFFPISDERLEVARILSVFGRPVRIRSQVLFDLCATSGIDVDGTVAACDGLIEAGVLLETRDAGYHFAHPMLRDALYSSLGSAHRSRLHQWVAQSLEAGAGSPRDVFEIASHLLDSGIDDAATTAAVLRAAAAAEQTSSSAAVYWLETCLRILPVGAPARSNVYFRLIYAQLAAWLPREASAVARRAVDECGITADSALIVLPAAVAHLYSGDAEGIVDLLDSVRFSALDPLVAGWLAGFRPLAHYFADDAKRAAEAYAEIAEEGTENVTEDVTEDVTEPDAVTAPAAVLSEMVLVAYTALSGGGRYPVHAKRSRAMLALLPTPNRREVGACLAFLEMLGRGHVGEARALIADAYERPLIGGERGLFGGANATAWILILWFEGDLQGAQAIARSASHENDAVGSLMLQGGTAAFDVLLCLELGRVKEAVTLAAVLQSRHPGDEGWVALARARVNVALGQVDAAREGLAAHLERCATTQATAGSGPVVEDLVRLELSAGNVASARTIAGDYFARSESLGWPMMHVYALRALGTAHRRATEIEQARAICVEIGLTFEMLVCDLRLGEVVEDAAAPLTNAYRGFQRLGAFASGRLARAEMRRRGIPVPRERAHEDSGAKGTEAQIVGLIAQGLTNRAIADSLHVSVKTVEAYLSRIYAREGVRTRVELVAKMLGPSVLDPPGRGI